MMSAAIFGVMLRSGQQCYRRGAISVPSAVLSHRRASLEAKSRCPSRIRVSLPLNDQSASIRKLQRCHFWGESGEITSDSGYSGFLNGTVVALKRQTEPEVCLSVCASTPTDRTSCTEQPIVERFDTGCQRLAQQIARTDSAQGEVGPGGINQERVSGTLP